MAASHSAIYTSKAPKPPSFISQGTVLGNLVFASGQVGILPETGALIQGTTKDQTRQTLSNIQVVLEAAGTSLLEVVKVNVFLTDMSDFAAVNEVYETFFPDPKPARTCVGVESLPLPGAKVEIECIANLPLVPKSHI